MLLSGFTNGIASAFGNVGIEVRGDDTEISGVRSHFLQSDLKRLYGTTRVGLNIIDAKKYSFVIKSFFLPDFLFIINQLLANKNRYGLPINTLYKIKQLLLEHTWLKSIDKKQPAKLDRSKLKHFKISPLDFQEELFDAYEQNTQAFRLNGFLFAGAAGSGKSYTSLAIAECLEADKIIIVSPKNAMHTAWVDNITRHYIREQDYWTSDSNIQFTGRERYLIVNYEYLHKLLEQIKSLKYKKLFIVLDESHNLNESTSARSEYFIQLCKQTNCTDVLWLSGTPFKAMSLEAIPFLRCIDPLFTPEVEEKFKAIFRGDSSAATTILNNRLGIVSFKVEKERLNLAAPIFKSIPITFKDSELYTLDSIKEQMSQFIKERKAYYDSRKEEDKQFFYFWLRQYELSLRNQKDIQEYQLYREALAYIIKTNADASAKEQIVFCNKIEKTKIIPIIPTDLRQQFIEVRSVIKYLHLKIQGECLGRVVGKARINCHVEMAKHIQYSDVCESTEKKTIVFTSYVEVLEQAANTALQQELAPAVVYAKTNANLSNIVSQFASDKRVNPLIATYASLSTAVPLVMADTMILIDVPFRDYILQQTVSRIHRIGSDTQTTVYTCTLDTQGKPNISTRTVDILKWSQQETEAILGITSPFDIRDTDSSVQTALEAYTSQLEGEAHHFSIKGTMKPKSLLW
jgi:superfamily II DNA or RNA helicase